MDSSNTHEHWIVKETQTHPMLEIKILGSGCSRCEALEKLVKKAVEEMNLDARVEKVGDIQEILKYSVMRTPALVINEKVLLSGVVPRMTELKSLLFSVNLPK